MAVSHIQPTEYIALAGVTNPANINGTTVNQAGIDMSLFHDAMFVLLAGAIDANLNAKLQESTDNSSFSDVTGKAMTQLTGTDDNKQVAFIIKGSELTKRYVRLSITSTAGTTNIVGSVGFGINPKSNVGTSLDLSTLAQIV